MSELWLKKTAENCFDTRQLMKRDKTTVQNYASDKTKYYSCIF